MYARAFDHFRSATHLIGDETARVLAHGPKHLEQMARHTDDTTAVQKRKERRCIGIGVLIPTLVLDHVLLQ